jgi:hypothetical protein
VQAGVGAESSEDLCSNLLLHVRIAREVRLDILPPSSFLAAQSFVSYLPADEVVCDVIGCVAFALVEEFGNLGSGSADGDAAGELQGD